MAWGCRGSSVDDSVFLESYFEGVSDGDVPGTSVSRADDVTFADPVCKPPRAVAPRGLTLSEKVVLNAFALRLLSHVFTLDEPTLRMRLQMRVRESLPFSRL